MDVLTYEHTFRIKPQILQPIFDSEKCQCLTQTKSKLTHRKTFSCMKEKSDELAFELYGA